jgi:hypothetical protein
VRFNRTDNALAAFDRDRVLWRRLALIAYVCGILAYRDAIMDDTFIHLQYARNLRDAGEIAFNRGEPSLGATSPLWMCALAATGATPLPARLLSLVCGALSVWVFARVAQRVLGPGAWAAAATVAWAGSLWLVRHAPNGMESTAATLALLVCVDLRLQGGRHPGRDALFGAAAAAAALLRPETILFAAIALAADVRTPWGRARLVTWLPVLVLPLLAWAWFAEDRTGHILPVTGSAKSGGFDFAPLTWLRVVWRQLRIVGAAHAVELAGCVAALVVAWRAGGGHSVWRAMRAHALVPYALFALGLAAVYTVFDLQVQPRYLLPALPCVVLAGFAAWKQVRGGAAAAAAVAAASLVVGVVSGARSVYPATRDFARGVRDVLAPMAQDIAGRDLERVVVASPDIGVLGYYSGARILDLGGLVDARVQAIVDDVGYDAMLEQGLFLDLGHADFVVDRSLERERFDGLETRGLHWRALRTGAVRGLGISRPRTYHYTLYALEPPSAYGSRAPSRHPIDHAALQR